MNNPRRIRHRARPWLCQCGEPMDIHETRWQALMRRLFG